MTNKKNRLLFIVFTAFLIFGGFITKVQPNSAIMLLNSSEDRNSIHTEEIFQENSIDPKAQIVFTNGSYLSDFEVPEYCTTLAIANDVLFIGTGNKGVYVLNISNPENLVILSHYDENNIYCQDFLIENDILYISEESFGLRVLNVSDIYSITEISFFDQDTTEFVYDSVISEGNMYLTSYNYMLKIVDLADLTATIPAFTVINEVLGRGRKLGIYNNTAYISCERYTTPSWYPYLRWYDLLDPLNPIYISQIPLKVWDFEFDNGVMYLSSTDGIHIYNISNPYNLFEISHVPFAESVEFELAFDNNILIAGSKYTDHSDTYLTAFNVSDPHYPDLLWNITTYKSGDEGEIEEMVINDGLIYASQFMHGLVVYDTGLDTDEDGLSDRLEQYTYHSDPTIQDTDEDGLLDGEEVYTYATDPINNDTDGDLLMDGDEITTYSTDPTDSDSDGDGLSDGDEINTYSTDPTDSDSDGDGLSDGDEINTYSTDPTDSDSDGDDFSDGEEITAGTNPNDPNDFPSTDTNGGLDIPSFPLALIGLISIISVSMLLMLVKKDRIH
jgi:hypothetical protein